MNARLPVGAGLCGCVAAVSLLLAGAGGAATPSVGFGSKQYVDTALAGGEPIIMADTLHGTLVYTSHEGTTHLYRNGLVSSPFGDFQFYANYCNQVNVWTSSDGGLTWQRDRYLADVDPCATNPAINTGFSDPDLTIDASGRVYDTGIDLVNDSLFSSGDGGKTWDRGTPNCHDGDRPWLAGGKADQVFMATDTVENELSHQVFESTDGGQTCSSSGVPDTGTTADGATYSGDGKLYYDRLKGGLVEPAIFLGPNGTFGVGISTWQPGQAQFTPHRAVASTSMFAHWPAMAIDSAGTVYVVWDTDDRQAGTSGGCDGNATPAPNKVMLVYTKDLGKTWSKPTTVAAPSNARVLWPWIAAGDRGRASVVWYQTAPGQVLDLDCQAGTILVYESSLFGLGTSRPKTYGPVDAAHGPIHHGTVCQGGTSCVATGQDRRLGDFFTNALDARGCVMIASGDTNLLDPLTGGPLPTSRPIFVHQNAGPALIGNGTCS